MFLCVFGENKDFYHIYSVGLPMSAAHMHSYLFLGVHVFPTLYQWFWVG